MKVGVTVWGERISPVFDSARALLVVQAEDGRIISRQQEFFRADCPAELIGILKRNGISVLLCGAISWEPAHMVEAEGIELVPFVTGCVEQVLGAYVQGKSILTYMMPGCRGNGPHGRRECCRKGRNDLPVSRTEVESHQEE
jgi:predicted Fe-Mo cluster-binding NifX family protein